MKILFLGKFPPIEGGVSSQAYWLTHGLAKRGHAIHVVTDARGVEENFRVQMNPDDWERCEADYGSGAVKVHWIDEFGPEQSHIPSNDPVVTKLTSVALTLTATHDFDAIVSYYLEPYGVAGHLIAAETNLPHIVKTAGSDVGRLWRQPHLKPLYDRVFAAAAAIITATSVQEELIESGIGATRICPSTAMVVPTELFSPGGPSLQGLENLRPDLNYFGLYGKISPKKGVFALLEAVAKVAHHGLPAGALLMVQGTDEGERMLTDKIRDLGIGDRVVRVPFQPHWRVPEFIRRCFAVCSLEQDFPITLHRPLVAREILACGGCLIASTEILGKLPVPERLVDGFNCVAIEDTKNGTELAGMMAAVLRHPNRSAAMKRRARNYYSGLPIGTDWIAEFESIIATTARDGRPNVHQGPEAAATENTGARLIDSALASVPTSVGVDIEAGKRVPDHYRAQAEAYRLGRLLLSLDNSTNPEATDSGPDHFRLIIDDWAIDEMAFENAAPALAPNALIEQFEVEMSAILTSILTNNLDGTVEPAFPPEVPIGPSYVLLKPESGSKSPRLFTITADIYAFLMACDGQRSLREIISEVAVHTKIEIHELEFLFTANIIALSPAPALVES